MTGIDLFAGAGGFSLGMKKAGIKVLAAVEKDKYAAQTYRANHRDTILIEQDIQKITAESLLEAARLKKGELDILFGGPPCQAFSFISKSRSLDNPKSKLMHEFIRMVEGIQPRIFYIENVPGLFAYKDFFIFLMEKLEKCGYVVRCLMMDAVSYGVPQFRKRIFIQGTRLDLGILPAFPPPTHFDPETDKKALDKGSLFPPSALVDECFAINGFSKEEVKDLYWNRTLHIQMNRKTAEFVWEKAIGKLLGQAIRSARPWKEKLYANRNQHQWTTLVFGQPRCGNAGMYLLGLWQRD